MDGQTALMERCKRNISGIDEELAIQEDRWQLSVARAWEKQAKEEGESLDNGNFTFKKRRRVRAPLALSAFEGSGSTHSQEDWASDSGEEFEMTESETEM